MTHSVNGDEHHFRVIQFPLNLIEHDALQSTAGQPSLIERAKVRTFDTSKDVILIVG